MSTQEREHAAVVQSADNPIRRLSAHLRTAFRETLFGSEALEVLARVGHASRGIVYVLLGLLAVTSTLNETRPPSLSRAFSVIDELPGGWLLLLAVAVGLCAYGAWRVLEALLDLQGCGWRAKGLLRRAGSLVEGISYAGLGLFAAIISISRNTGISGEIREEAAVVVAWTARILEWPLGHWLVGAVGLGAIATGCAQFLKARENAFKDIEASRRAMIAIRLVGRIGFAAKGVIFAATGVLFVIAAWRVEASTAGGMRAALSALAEVPFGDWVLLLVSAGLTLYGVFSLIKAWLHKPVNP